MAKQDALYDQTINSPAIQATAATSIASVVRPLGTESYMNVR